MDRLLIAGLVRCALSPYLPPGKRLRVVVQGGPMPPLHVVVDLPGATGPDGATILSLARSLRQRAARRGGTVLPILMIRCADGSHGKGRCDPR